MQLTKTPPKTAIPWAIGILVGLYSAYMTLKIRNYADPNGNLSLGASLAGFGKHITGNPEFSTANIDRMAAAKKSLDKSRKV